MTDSNELKLLRKVRSIMNRMSNADITPNEIYSELETIEESLLNSIPKTEDDLRFETLLDKAFNDFLNLENP